MSGGARASLRGIAGALLGFLAGGYLAGFNENLVNMALVPIMAQFAIDAMTAQWLVTGFMLVTVVAVGAPLHRRFGARRLLFAALGFTAAGSLAGW